MFRNKLSVSAVSVVIAALLCLSSSANAADAKKKSSKATPVKTAAVAKETANKKEVIATVNGQPIYDLDLQRAKKMFMNGQGNKAPMTPEQEKEFRAMAIENLTNAELLYQAGLKSAPQDIDQQVTGRIEQGKKRFKNAEDFKKAIQALGMNEAELSDYTKRDIIIGNFIEKNIITKVTVSDEETKKFYDENPDKFKQPEAVRASHILIAIDAKATADEKKKALEKAEKIRKDLAGGADFATVARESSSCPSKQQGGDLGYFSKGQMVPEFEKAAYGLKPGEISDVVETKFGYHIIKQVEKREAGTVEYKVVKDNLTEFMKGKKVSAAIQAFLVDARKTAKIVVN